MDVTEGRCWTKWHLGRGPASLRVVWFSQVRRCSVCGCEDAHLGAASVCLQGWGYVR